MSDGWSWKFDPSIWQRFSVSRAPQDLLKATRCRIALMKGDKSVIWDADVGDYMRDLLEPAGARSSRSPKRATM